MRDLESGSSRRNVSNLGGEESRGYRETPVPLFRGERKVTKRGRGEGMTSDVINQDTGGVGSFQGGREKCLAGCRKPEENADYTP